MLLKWAAIFFVIAIIAAAFGFGGIAEGVDVVVAVDEPGGIRGRSHNSIVRLRRARVRAVPSPDGRRPV